METLSIKERMELSKILGAPIDGISAKADKFIKKLEPMLLDMASGPREAVLLLAMAYVCFNIRCSVDPTDDKIIDQSKELLDGVLGLISAMGESYER